MDRVQVFTLVGYILFLLICARFRNEVSRM